MPDAGKSFLISKLEFFLAEYEPFSGGTSTPATGLKDVTYVPSCRDQVDHNTEMNETLSSLLQGRFDKVDTSFAVSARCIFVHKNNLAPRAWRCSGTGKASELGFPECPNLQSCFDPL
jgi:hypothetical protein